VTSKLYVPFLIPLKYVVLTRALKTNVLITADGTAVISDFGASHTLGGPYVGDLPCTNNHPPEFLRGDTPTTASDIWSMACTACEVSQK
jgi:serine/threonine protein kinase